MLKRVMRLDVSVACFYMRPWHVYRDLMSEGYQESCGYALYESQLTYIAHVDLVGDPLQVTCHARASEILITKVCKISTEDFVGSFRSTWHRGTWIFEPSLVVRPRDRVMTDKLIIAYSSIWPVLGKKLWTRWEGAI